MFTTVRNKLLAFFAAIEKPAAWALLFGAIITFGGVLVGWITVGEFKWPTLLIAADLTVSGFTAVQEAEDDEDTPEDEGKGESAADPRS